MSCLRVVLNPLCEVKGYQQMTAPCVKMTQPGSDELQGSSGRRHREGVPIVSFVEPLIKDAGRLSVAGDCTGIEKVGEGDAISPVIHLADGALHDQSTHHLSCFIDAAGLRKLEGDHGVSV